MIRINLMRVAIFHDYLNQFGGAERVLLAFLELFPEADLYTILYDERKTFGFFRNKVTGTSFLDFQTVRKRHRFFIPLMPWASEKMVIKNNYDLIISSTAGYAKGFNYSRRHGYIPFHICYCHSPLRYAWEFDYLKDVPFAPWPFKELVVKPVANWLRKWDLRTADRVNIFIANSKFIAQKIKFYYKREASVIYPPVDLGKFYYDPPPHSNRLKSEDYYLMVGRLLYYKRFDLGIEVFNRLKLPLKIVGLGPEAEKLKRNANLNFIDFIPAATDEELKNIYNRARALIFPQIEDFGLVAAEAQACGLPVIAFDGGGAREIVVERKTGLFFKEQTPAALVRAIKEFEKLKFDRSEIAEQARRFSKEKFKSAFAEAVRKNGFEI